jgi:gas vesicle protein GvpL/GvpF
VSAASEAVPLGEDDAGWYLYGVVAAERAPSRFDSWPVVDPRHEVVVLAEGPLAGVTSRVSLQEFDQAALPDRLGDAAWLEQKIRAHEQVLEGVLTIAPVVPCRFCTVYRSEEDLRHFLSERGDALTQALATVAGRVELGVKAFVDRERFATGGALRNESIRELAERVSHGQGGRAYLEARRLEQLVNDELATFKGEVGADLHSRLRAAAEDGLQLNLQRPELSGREEEMLFNGAYLVEDKARFEQALTALADEYRESGVEFELTGPWPPYNFVPLELGRP